MLRRRVLLLLPDFRMLALFFVAVEIIICWAGSVGSSKLGVALLSAGVGLWAWPRTSTWKLFTYLPRGT